MLPGFFDEQRLPEYALDRDTYLKNSPEMVWKRLRAEHALADPDDAALWDAVACFGRARPHPKSWQKQQASMRPTAPPVTVRPVRAMA